MSYVKRERLGFWGWRQQLHATAWWPLAWAASLLVDGGRFCVGTNPETAPVPAAKGSLAPPGVTAETMRGRVNQGGVGQLVAIPVLGP